MLANLSPKELEKMAAEIFGEKFILTCSIHKRGYGSKRPPVFKCKECMMVDYVGLICNIPADRRLEVLEMLEYSAHHLVEAEARGEIDALKLYRHPQVSIARNVKE